MNLKENLRTSVLKTLAWFDIFDYPPTPVELHKQLWEFNFDIDYGGFLDFLDTMERDGSIVQSAGCVTLSDRSDLIAKRNAAVGLIERKLKIAKRAVQKIYWIPFVRGVFLCNTVAFGWPKDTSDVDVFIVIKQGRLWVTRFLVTMMLSLFGLRRNKKRTKDKICLSFYITDQALNLSDIQIVKPDVYLVYWLRNLMPLYDPNNVLAHIINANAWIYDHTNPTFVRDTLHRYTAEQKRFGLFMKRTLQSLWKGAYGDILEKQSRHIQKQRMKKNTDSVQDEKDSRVIVTDEMLKFHENDRRLLFKQMWEERYKTVISSG